MEEKKVYTLSQLTESISSVINKAYKNKFFWIKTEIVRLNHYTHSGHCYPDLVEKRQGKIVAEIRGNIWRQDFQRINHKFRKALNQELGDNMTVVLYASVSYHPKYGVALHIKDVDPEYTLGELARQKAISLQKLSKEGLLELNKQKSLPEIPKVLAVVSVHTSKGYNDFVNVIKQNEYNYCFHHKLFPALLQGDRATDSILGQLKRIEKYQDIFDAVAIIRGGGGDVGLSCYDSYRLSKAVAEFPLPVLTGIGHSTNETVTEMVSFKSFITPTKIAEFLIQQFFSFNKKLDEQQQRLSHMAKDSLNKKRNELDDTVHLFRLLSMQSLSSETKTIKNMAGRLGSATKNRLKHEKMLMEHLSAKLQVLSPQSILRRGYSITRINGKVVTSVNQLQTDEMVETQLEDGIFNSKIVDKQHKK